MELFRAPKNLVQSGKVVSTTLPWSPIASALKAFSSELIE